MALAREVLAGLADALALSREQYDDIRTAATEACNNVVQHAYEDEEGPLEMEVRVVRDAVELLVRDAGVGMSHIAEDGLPELAIGLPAMLALSDRFEVAHVPEGGTEVRMRFLAPGVEAQDRRADESDGPPEIVLPDVQGAIRVAFATAELAGAILPRVAGALAARAHFTADRVADVQMLSDAIAAGAIGLANGPHLEVAFAAARRELGMQVGPLVRGGAERLLSAWRLPNGDRSGSAPTMARLSDERSVTAIGPDEVLLLRVRDTARPASGHRAPSAR